MARARTRFDTPLADLLDARTRPAVLYERLPDNRVRCSACGHRCLILDGLRGICQVRFNQGGVLYAPWGYVGPLQLDPTEKKPFFHLLPGSWTLTFGMLGCDYHCPYCLAGGTRIMTADGPRRLETLFAEGTPDLATPSAVRRPAGTCLVYTHTGQRQAVTRVFRHPYTGPLLRLHLRYLPPIECTPEHEFLVLRSAGETPAPTPSFVRAEAIRPGDFLAVPKRLCRPAGATTISVSGILRPPVQPPREWRRLSPAPVTQMAALSAAGRPSAAIGQCAGQSASHVRPLRHTIDREVWNLDTWAPIRSPLAIEDGRIRFPEEHCPGIPERLTLDERLAALLGYYCAKGHVSPSKNGVRSATLVFSCGPEEETLATEVAHLLTDIFGVRPTRVRRETTLGLEVEKTSLAFLFASLCGERARTKRVPPALFHAPPEVIRSFLRACAGHGHTRPDGLTAITTVSEDLAFGLAWLALSVGLFPALRVSEKTRPRPITGRQVASSSRIYSVTWYFDGRPRKYLREDQNYWYIPVQNIERIAYAGDVFNLEVAGDQSYLAPFVATHNCQNWFTSQALRDPAAGRGITITDLAPEALARLARRAGAAVVGSSYNEPLITAEWAVAVFQAARALGLKTVFVSNGNATPEVLAYLRPWLDGYKVDLKAMSERRYRALGGRLSTVLDTIQRAWRLGFWVEVVTLVIPGWNDSEAELREAARFLAGVSPDIPWHVTAFHPDYKMTEPENTGPATLRRAAEIGREEGLRFVYAGNLPGQVGPFENTYCPGCQRLLIERHGFRVRQNHLTPDGRCPDCQTPIPGIWR